MSYARFSSDDFQSDVYVYDSNAGYVTHVARNRKVLAEPLPEPVELLHLPEAGTGVTEDEFTRAAQAFLARHKRVHAILERSESKPIGLAHDGEMFVHATAGECADNLERLAEIGYHVPGFTLRALRAERTELEGA